MVYINQVEFYIWTSFLILYSICKKTRGETIRSHFQPEGSLQRMLQKEEEPLLSVLIKSIDHKLSFCNLGLKSESISFFKMIYVFILCGL